MSNFLRSLRYIMLGLFIISLIFISNMMSNQEIVRKPSARVYIDTALINQVLTSSPADNLSTLGGTDAKMPTALNGQAPAQSTASPAAAQASQTTQQKAATDATQKATVGASTAGAVRN